MPWKIRQKLCEQCKKEYSTSRSNPHSRFCSDRCRGDAKMGKKHPRWTGGRSVNKRSGYVSISYNGITKMEHRHIMEQHLGRPLLRTEHVHHKDGNRSNNDISNLELCQSQRDHIRKHLNHWTNDGRKRCSKCKEYKTVDHFLPRPDRNSYKSECKECQQLYRDKNRDELNRRAREAYRLKKSQPRRYVSVHYVVNG